MLISGHQTDSVCTLVLLDLRCCSLQHFHRNQREIVKTSIAIETAATRVFGPVSIRDLGHNLVIDYGRYDLDVLKFVRR
jgi:hypothetical protein